ncbi:hypothetical protein [Calothrix sp. PCC 7507]|uniref:hypothetical protein n=1 Tax=Calothrix sp. PCC 7507 TaxID=99598 RepID=UPI00029EEFBA|nr:hypothetical protein [Calothrix sp. PCC 7507]AFY35372.1 hypothetical protein Cal7507_5023 [Calothrix sp. PCC 7507]
MSETSPNRLDRIEAILEQVAQQQAANTIAIAQLTVRTDGLTEDVTSLKDDVTSLKDDVTSLTDIVMHSIQNAEIDREMFQAESRRIWEYLLGQQRNGNGRSEE